MAIPIPPCQEERLNTVAVIPVILPSPSPSRQSSSPASILPRAASNLIHAIAQGSWSHPSDDPEQIERGASHLSKGDEDGDEDEDEDGASSFTYVAAERIRDSDDPSAAPRARHEAVPWHISNRYYEADVTLKTFPTLITTVVSTEAMTRTYNEVLQDSRRALDGIPAYVVVVDRNKTLDEHRSILTQIESSVVSGFQAEVSVVAGVTVLDPSANSRIVTLLEDERRPSQSSQRADASNSTPPTIADLVSLYAEYGWEFIAIDEEDEEPVDDRESDDRSESMDKGGVERIREALMNHMWNGLKRKTPTGPTFSDSLVGGGSVSTSAAQGLGFSDTLPLPDDRDDPADGVDDGSRALAGLSPSTVSRDNEALTTGNKLQNLLSGVLLPDLGVTTHAETGDLDEKLAKLFLASSENASDLADLEAFLEAEDPTWPSARSETRTSVTTGEDGATPTEHVDGGGQVVEAKFENDFDDFLPFQSGVPVSALSSERSATWPSGGSGTRLDVGIADVPVDDDVFPSDADVVQMHDRLFGANAASRLEADALGFDRPSTSEAQEHDLATQLQPLHWHAQRVRDIHDPVQRRKEAALVALAFSMQWGSESASSINGSM